MILFEATIKYKGYDPNTLSKGSHKRVCVSCDRCGRVRYVPYQSYRDLCVVCSTKGKNNPNFGKHWSDEVKEKMSKSHIGKKHTKEEIKKQIKNQSKDNHWNYGKHLSDETKIKISCGHQNIKVENFDGFLTEQKYCSKFNEFLREQIRNKYNRECFICSKNEKENLTKNDIEWKLSIHHVDMNKQCGCDNNKCILIPLCLECHGRVHNNLWKYRLEYLLK